MDYSGYTDAGPREANEDSYYVFRFPDSCSFSNGIRTFVMVSDGMGGYQYGDVASGVAVACAERYLAQLQDMANGNRVELDAATALNEIVHSAHDEIVNESNASGGIGMGATFVGAFISKSHAWIGHVGDSRAYLISKGEARQLTEDHSQVGRMLSRGLITEQQAQIHPERNKIERALGFTSGDAEITEVEIGQNDALLLCSDGVSTVVDQKMLSACVSKAKSADRAAKNVVKTAVKNGTDDNSTAVVVYPWRTAGAAAAQTIAGTMPVIPAASTAPTQRRPSQSAERTPRSQNNARSMHRGAHTSRARSTRNRKQSNGIKRPIILLLVAFVLLLGIGVGLFIGAGGVGQNGQNSESAIQTQSQQDGSQAGTVSTAEEPTSTQGALPNASAGQTGELSSFVVAASSSSEPAVLKYVDSNGYARRFSDNPLGVDDPALKSNASVKAKTTSVEYDIGNGRQRSYNDLDSEYLDALNNDLSAREAGETITSSPLLQLIDSSTYTGFLDALLQDTSDSQRRSIKKLIISSEELKPSEGSSSVISGGATSAGQSSGSSASSGGSTNGTGPYSSNLSANGSEVE